MSEDAMEKELLRSIDDVDAKLQVFRKKVQAVLSDLQSEKNKPSDSTDTAAQTINTGSNNLDHGFQRHHKVFAFVGDVRISAPDLWFGTGHVTEFVIA